MEIEDPNKKMKLLLENLPSVFAKEIEKFITCIEELKSEQNLLNNKLISLIDKLENSIQQYELVNHESEYCKNNLTIVIGTINKKILIEIFRIKNPNETIYELMKMLYIILSDVGIEFNQNVSWMYLESVIINKNLKKEFDKILALELNKDLIDLAMPFSINYTEIKNSLAKINKNLVLILDFIKAIVDHNVKRNIVKSLFQSNLNKHNKLSSLKSEVEIKENLLKFSIEYLSIMQRELSLMLTQTNSSSTMHQNLVFKYDMIEKYKICINSETLRGSSKPKISIKLRKKYMSTESFVHTIIEAKDKNIYFQPDSDAYNKKSNYYPMGCSDENSSNLNLDLEDKSSEKPSDNKRWNNEKITKKTFIPKLNLPKQNAMNFENISVKSRNINQNIYYNNNTNALNLCKNTSNQTITNNIPHRVYYTTTRTGDKTNSKTIGSTICRDLEAFENIIKDDKLCDAIPIHRAVKPVPKSFIQDNSKNKKISSFSLEEQRIEDNINLNEHRGNFNPCPNSLKEINNNENNYYSKLRMSKDHCNKIDSEFNLNDGDFFEKIELNPERKFLKKELEEEGEVGSKNVAEGVDRELNKMPEKIVPNASSIDENIKNVKIDKKEHKKMSSLFENLDSLNQINTEKPLKKGRSLKIDSKGSGSNYLCC